MPGHFHHSLMTREALAALPDSLGARLPAGSRQLLVESCCMNPDRYFDLTGGGYERIKPYTLLIDGIQFHYLPNTPIEGEYKYWGVEEAPDGQRRLRRIRVETNENWRHAWAGFTYYIEQSVLRLREGRFEEAMNYLGILLHTLQDASTFLHSLEGPDGLDLFALDRLMETPAGRYDLLPTCLLGGNKVDCRIGDYGPALLGLSVPEAAFRLYSAYARTVASNRRKLIPLLLKSRAGDGARADALSVEIIQGAARLCADVVCTVCCLAFDAIDPARREALQTVHLSDLKPIREPRGLSGAYRFISWIPDAALDPEFTPRPLILVVNGSRTVFDKGIGSGSHFNYTLAWELPAQVYRQFSGAVGLHADLSRQGDFTAEIRVGGRTLLRQPISAAQPAVPFAFPVDAGGVLELRVESPFGMGDARQRLNSIVWGDLTLAK